MHKNYSVKEFEKQKVSSNLENRYKCLEGLSKYNQVMQWKFLRLTKRFVIWKKCKNNWEGLGCTRKLFSEGALELTQVSNLQNPQKC